MKIETNYIDNCSHGYLKVSISDFKKVLTKDEAKKVSFYSGIESGYILLEEDCDAGLFLEAAKNKGVDVIIFQDYRPDFICAKNYCINKLAF